MLPPLLAALLGGVPGLVVSGARAQEPAGPGPWTPVGAAEQALRANPELRAVREAIEAARGRRVEAGLWPNPELSLVAVDDFAFDRSGERSWGAELAQRVPPAGRLARARELANVDVDLAAAELAEFGRALVGEAQSTVLEILALDRALAEQADVIEAARTLARVSRARLRAAETSEPEVSLLEIESARLEQDLRLLELERSTGAIRLNRLLGLPPDATITVAGRLEAPAFEARSREELVRTAFERRPDLHQLRLERDRSAAEERLARAEAWDDWTVALGYEGERQVIDAPAAAAIPAQRDDFLALKLSVPLPFFDRNQGRVATAGAEARGAEARAAALELAIRAEIAGALRRVEELSRVAAEYEASIAPRARRNLAALQRGYGQGLVGIAEVVQAEQQYAAVAVRRARLLGELRRAEVDLETAAAASELLEAESAAGSGP